MLATKDGSEDGFSARTFLEGQEYDLSEALALAFIAGGDAEAVEQKRPRKK